MILSTQEFLVVVEGIRQMYFVTGRTEICRLMEIFEERFLMQRGLGLHELIVYPLQRDVVTEGERILLRFFNREIGVTARAVDMRDRMANGAGDPRLGCRMLHVIELRIVESIAEEGDRIVAAGTES